MIELQDTIDMIIGDETLEAFRDGDVIYIDGKPQKINKTKFCFDCNVQPLGGRDLLMVPEGDRYKEMYNLWTKGMPLKDNDRIKRLGKFYQVQSLENWGSYQKAKIMLDDTGEFSND
jgi:hypothetical protein